MKKILTIVFGIGILVGTGIGWIIQEFRHERNMKIKSGDYISRVTEKLRKLWEGEPL